MITWVGGFEGDHAYPPQCFKPESQKCQFSNLKMGILLINKAF